MIASDPVDQAERRRQRSSPGCRRT
jgi:hypothetical protein